MTGAVDDCELTGGEVGRGVGVSEGGEAEVCEWRGGERHAC